MLPVLNAAFSLWRIHLKNCKTSLKKLKSSMACRIFRKSKTTLWVWFFPESSRVRISPSFPTIAAYPVDLPNAGVALSNLTIFQMRCCQHREMFKIGKKILETWNICENVWICIQIGSPKFIRNGSIYLEVYCRLSTKQLPSTFNSQRGVGSAIVVVSCPELQVGSNGVILFPPQNHVLPKWCLLDASWLIIHPVA